MRLATITNWAYGATVLLTAVSASSMLLASNTQSNERAAVEQRYRLDKATDALDASVFALTDRARQYLDTGDPTYRMLYQREAAALGHVETRLRTLRDAGASDAELVLLKAAIGWADGLRDEQRAAIAAHARGDEKTGRTLLFGAEYERELDRARTSVDRFQDRLDQRTDAQVRDAAQLARLWKTISESVLAGTGLLFLCVLFFVFKQRVLRPVVRLSDVVTRLAAQDFDVEPPTIGRVDEIGDMAQAIRIFRENGLERQRLEAQRSADLATRDLLSRMTQRMQGSDTLLDLTDVVQRFVPEIAPALAGSLYLLDPARNAVAVACTWLEPAHSRADFAPTGCWALRRGLPHRPAGDQIDIVCGHLVSDGEGVPDTLCLPLTAQRETLGMLYFEPRRDGVVHPETPAIYLQMLAENIGLALGNLRLREALRSLALTDPLTGLGNRRQFESVLEARLAEADRRAQPIDCMMIDIDFFKGINDRFGHDAGDAVLREVGTAIRHFAGEQRDAFRFGGEEFVMLMSGAAAGHAETRAEAVRARIADLRLTHDGMDLGRITASIGVARAPYHCALDRLVATADASLYRAKAAGRDRVVIATRREQRGAA